MYFPLFLNIKNSKFLIVGAGNIGLAKLETILEFSGKVSILAPEILPQIAEKNVEIIQAAYDKKYLANFDIIIAATDEHSINEQVSKDAQELKKLVNVVDDAKNSLFIFGANVKRKEIVISASTSGVSPVLSRLLKQKLQKFLPENFSNLSDFLEKNRDVVKEKLTNIQARRLFWQEAIEGVIGLEVLAGNIAKAQELLESKLQNSANKKEAAIYFISAGPGDPELFTLKGVNLLSKADVVLYDRLVSPEILNHARKDALKINVGKTRDLHRYRQEEINQLLVKYATEGNIVARLKGGDAGIFGRLGEEIEAIKDLKIPYQIVPGITAASGAAAYAGIPLTSRNTNKSVRFLSIYQDDMVSKSFWNELAASNDSLVLYMSAHHLADIVKNLLAAGKAATTPFVVIEQATTPFQKTYNFTLESYQDRKFISPSLVIIGDVVNNRFDWREEVLSGEYFQKLEERND